MEMCCFYCFTGGPWDCHHFESFNGPTVRATTFLSLKVLGELPHVDVVSSRPLPASKPI